MALKDEEFWKDELNDPAQAVALKLLELKDVAKTDAPTSMNESDYPAGSGGELGLYAAIADSSERAAKRPRTNDYDTRSMIPFSPPPPVATLTPARIPKGQACMIKNGHFITNKQGYFVCPGFNDGTCPGRGRCPNNTGTHQCSICFQNGHGYSDGAKCPKQGQWAEVKQQYGSKGGKGGKRTKGGKWW